MRKILFSRNSEIIKPIRQLISEQKHQVIILWALECADVFLSIFERKFPNDLRPLYALQKAEAWAKGEIKMAEAKRAIIGAHNAATDANEYPAIEAAARAVGHAAASVHVETHAIGLILYGLTSLVYDGKEKIIKQFLDYSYNRLLHYQKNIQNFEITWASFITKDKPNKEKLLLDKE